MRLVSAFVLCAAIGACTPAPAAAPEPPASPAAPPVAVIIEPFHALPPPMPGGYASASLEDESVKAAEAVAIDAIYTRAPTRALIEKVEASVQVVAGFNYAFAITMTGGARYNVVVFRNLQNKLSVTSFAKID